VDLDGPNLIMYTEATSV